MKPRMTSTVNKDMYEAKMIPFSFIKEYPLEFIEYVDSINTGQGNSVQCPLRGGACRKQHGILDVFELTHYFEFCHMMRSTGDFCCVIRLVAIWLQNVHEKSDPEKIRIQ